MIGVMVIKLMRCIIPFMMSGDAVGSWDTVSGMVWLVDQRLKGN